MPGHSPSRDGGDRRERRAEVGHGTRSRRVLRPLGDRLEAVGDGGIEAAHAGDERIRKSRRSDVGRWWAIASCVRNTDWASAVARCSRSRAASPRGSGPPSSKAAWSAELLRGREVARGLQAQALGPLATAAWSSLRLPTVASRAMARSADPRLVHIAPDARIGQT